MSFDGSASFVCASRKEILVWTPTSNSAASFFLPTGIEASSSAAAILEDVQVVVVGTDTGKILIGDLANPGTLTDGFVAHQYRSPNDADPRILPASVSSVAVLEYDRQPHIISVGSEDRTIRLWVFNGRLVLTYPAARPGHPPGSWRTIISKFSMYPDVTPTLFAAGDLDGVCTVWNVTGEGEPIQIGEEERLTSSGANWVSALQFCRIKGRDAVVVGYRNGDVGFFDPTTGRQILTIETGSFIWSGGLSVNSDGRLFVAGRLGILAIQLNANWHAPKDPKSADGTEDRRPPNLPTSGAN